MDRPKDVHSVPAFSWRGALAPHVIAATLAPLFLAVALPGDVLERLPVLAALLDSLTEVFPSLLRTAEATVFPQVALVVLLSVIVGYAIVAFHFVWASLHVNRKVISARFRASGSTSPIKLTSVAIVGLVMSVGGLWAFVALPGDPSFAEGLTTRSRVGLGLLSSVLVWILGLLFGGAVSQLKLAIFDFAGRGSATH